MGGSGKEIPQGFPECDKIEMITFPTDTVTVIDQIREAIGRNITIQVLVSGIPCPDITDSLDPVTGLSTNQFCPTCSGIYWLSTLSGYLVKAHIRSGKMDTPVWVTAGEIFTGDAQVQIKYTLANMTAVENSEYFDVDGRRFVKSEVDLRGVPEINRILVTLEEQER